MADLFNIIIRTGCFCNSGSCQRHLTVTNKEMKDLYKAGHKCGDDFDLIAGKPTGAVRVSFGYFNTFNDVDTLMHMICRCFVKTQPLRPKREMINHKNNQVRDLDKTKMINGNTYHKMCKEQDYFRSNIAGITHFDDDIKLKELVIFPVKSCGAFKVKTSWKIGPKGLEYDREWMIIKDNGVCLTQKQNTRMCMIKPTVDLNNRVLILNFKG